MMAFSLSESNVVNNCLAKYWLSFWLMRVILTFLAHVILCPHKMPLDSSFGSHPLSLAINAAATSDFRVE